MGYLLGVRKGAWTREEDLLLKTCIEIYGEGNWHLVPKRAGLNRCRKSCRLRWLNYLHPNIKLGRFADDEIDLIIRLHKLLGNRWSLIAGRLPGRTANGVKNFWNSHLRKKFDIPNKEKKPSPSKKVDVIRPKPWTYATNLTPSKDLRASRDQQLKEECGFFDALWTPEDHAWLWTPEDHGGLWCNNLILREEEEENQGLYNQNLTDEVLSGSHWDGKTKSKEGGGEWDDLLSSISLWDHQIM